MIRDDRDVAEAIDRLVLLDPRLRPVAERAGPVPARRTQGGLAGLCATVVAQQVSRASADAIFSRLAAALDLDDAPTLAGASDELFRGVGLSRPKQRTLRALGEAVVDRRLSFERLERSSAEAAIAELVALHGIGRWTAECYLLFALGHDDILPAGDLALQIAAAVALDLPERPREQALRNIALAWSPCRSAAALLLWRYYHELTHREATPTPALGDRSGGKQRRSRPEPAARGFTKATR